MKTIVTIEVLIDCKEDAYSDKCAEINDTLEDITGVSVVDFGIEEDK
jgi:hypothetical protein